jgi:hypothetical protein
MNREYNMNIYTVIHEHLFLYIYALALHSGTQADGKKMNQPPDSGLAKCIIR